MGLTEAKQKKVRQLYDFLFDPLHGQVVITKHRDRISHRNLEWLQLRDLAKKISIIMC